MSKPRIVGIGGTARAGSSSEKLIAAVLAATAAEGADTKLFGGAMLAELPHFPADSGARSDAQRAFVDAVRSADGIVIGTPAYHGGVSGLVKNALDLIEDTRTDARTYLDGLPVGLIVTAGGWQAGGITLSALRGIVHALRGWPTPIGIIANTSEQALFDAKGVIANPALATSVETQAAQILRLARVNAAERG